MHANRSFAQSVVYHWRMFLRGILHWWVKSRILPDQSIIEDIDPDQPVCYVLDTYALSSLLILDHSCEKNGLPRPLQPMESVGQPRRFAVMKRLVGLFIRRPEKRRKSPMLEEIIQAGLANPQLDVQLVPVTVMIGRAPDKEDSLARILFSEDWELGGRFSRFVGTLINGRNTFVQFSEPLSLRELLDEDLGEERSVRKLTRILRTHFRRTKTAAIGPDLSHRRTLIAEILKSPSVKEAIEAKASRDDISKAQAKETAEKYALEIAADYSYSFVRAASLALTWFWNRIYRGVELYHFRDFQDRAPGFEVVYVPCHRSHMDYLLLSYLLYNHGFVPPHVAAGLNLNLPVVGRIIRWGGGFFLRRSFRAKPLYSAVFNEYVSTILARGVAIEYFIEGGRSRTGRLLEPKGGMLAMTVRGYLRAPSRPVLFQPVYIGYEKLAEGGAYIDELSGNEKKSESISDLRAILKVLRKNYGEVHVSFGEPLELNAVLDRKVPDWRDRTLGEEMKPAWLSPVVDELSETIMENINAAAVVNPINLIAVILLSTRKQAISAQDMEHQIGLYQTLLQLAPYDDRVAVTDQSPSEIIEYGIALGVIRRESHALGDIITATDRENAVLLTYFRNNVSHLFTLPSWIASYFLNQRQFPLDRLKRIALAVYPFVRSELFLPWDQGEFLKQLEANVYALAKLGIISVQGEGTILSRADGGSLEAMQLKLLAHAVLPTFQRYFITVAVLAKNGSGVLSRPELERLCKLTAERISLLHEFQSPEFSDRSLFRSFIARLVREGVLRRNADDKLEFDETLAAINEDAKLILSKEIRHSIIQVAPSTLEKPNSD